MTTNTDHEIQPHHHNKHRLERLENAADVWVIGAIIILGLVMIIGLITADGVVPWMSS